MKSRDTRRAFCLFAGASALFSPTVISAQSLGRNDIWGKEPKRTLHSAGILGQDGSGSMSKDELRIQADGTAQALESAVIRSIITQHDTYNDRQGVAVCLASFNTVARVIPLNLHSFGNNNIHSGNWAVLETNEDINQFAAHIRAGSPRNGAGGTNIIALLEVASSMHECMPYAAAKRFCDISTDGYQNEGNGVTNIASNDYPSLLFGQVATIAQKGILTNVFIMKGDEQKPSFVDPEGYTHVVELGKYHRNFTATQPTHAATGYQSGVVIPVDKNALDFARLYRNGMTRKMQQEFY